MSPFALEDGDNGIKRTSKSLFFLNNKKKQQPNFNIAVTTLLQAREKH